MSVSCILALSLVGVVVYSFFGVVAYIKLLVMLPDGYFFRRTGERFFGSILWPATLVIIMVYWCGKLVYSPVGAVVKFCRETREDIKALKKDMESIGRLDRPWDSPGGKIERMIPDVGRVSISRGNNLQERIEAIEKKLAKKTKKRKNGKGA